MKSKLLEIKLYYNKVSIYKIEKQISKLFPILYEKDEDFFFFFFVFYCESININIIIMFF